jgi:choline dehydrogenase-like flavoprotein
VRTTRVNVLVVGSGPIGATFARRVLDTVSDATVLMVDAGPQLTDAPGTNIRNLPIDQRIDLQERVSGPIPPQASRLGDRPVQARPGTTLLAADDGSGDGQQGMPGAALSTNVGGMGAHWTCAVPRPGGSERIPFLDPEELDQALDVAEELLSATTTAFRPSPAGKAVLAALHRRYDTVLPEGRRPGPMPLACRPNGTGLPQWAGVDTVLDRIDTPRLTVRADTLARRLLLDGDRVTGAELVHRPTGEVTIVQADAVAVAADAFRTPQLLWASGIRPAALGRYLNDQPQIVVGARVNVASTSATMDVVDARDTLTGVCWVPFVDGVHPFHGQVMQMEASPVTIVDQTEDRRPFVGLGWFAAKDVRAQDRVWFDDSRPDEFGMPAIRIEYGLSERDLITVDRARTELAAVAAEIGEATSDGILLPAGYSLHYQGSTRMGPSDDGTSVCDRDSRVWGFQNLFVGGNAVIPTATACNPTLTSMALAVIGARRIAALLARSKEEPCRVR